MKSRVIYKGSVMNICENHIYDIMLYFGVSRACAEYMYHRRRYSSPFLPESHFWYIHWCVECQNKMVKADFMGLAWESVNFTNDIYEINKRYNF